VDIRRGADNAFAQTEADREILQVLLRRHHDRVGPAVICKRYRGFFRDRTIARTRTAYSPNLVMDDQGGSITPLWAMPRGELRTDFGDAPLFMSNTFQLTR
jgi:hypothetical protein